MVTAPVMIKVLLLALVLTALALKLLLIELVLIVPVLIPQVLIALVLLALVQIFACVAKKLAPTKKNSRDISPVSPTFCISVYLMCVRLCLNPWTGQANCLTSDYSLHRSKMAFFLHLFESTSCCWIGAGTLKWQLTDTPEMLSG